MCTTPSCAVCNCSNCHATSAPGNVHRRWAPVRTSFCSVALSVYECRCLLSGSVTAARHHLLHLPPSPPLSVVERTSCTSWREGVHGRWLACMGSPRTGTHLRTLCASQNRMCITGEVVFAVLVDTHVFLSAKSVSMCLSPRTASEMASIGRSPKIVRTPRTLAVVCAYVYLYVRSV